VQLKGLAIGNGWIDPMQQYQGYVDFAYEKGLIKEGSKVSQCIFDAISVVLTDVMVTSIQEADAVETAMFECQSEVDKWMNKTTVPINLAHCDQVMGSVTAPFQQE
jgi:carboxypeptidase D